MTIDIQLERHHDDEVELSDPINLSEVNDTSIEFTSQKVPHTYTFKFKNRLEMLRFFDDVLEKLEKKTTSTAKG